MQGGSIGAAHPPAPAATSTQGPNECFHRPAGCSRYLSAHSDCGRPHPRLASRDGGSGLQRWKLVRVRVGSGGGGGGSAGSSPVLQGSTCASTGPGNCPGCCQSTFKEFDGSSLDDRSCIDTNEYPRCDFGGRARRQAVIADFLMKSVSVRPGRTREVTRLWRTWRVTTRVGATFQTYGYSVGRRTSASGPTGRSSTDPLSPPI